MKSNLMKSFVVTVGVLAIAICASGQTRVASDAPPITGESLVLSTNDSSIVYPLSLSAPNPYLELNALTNNGSSLRFMKLNYPTGYLGIAARNAEIIDDSLLGDLFVRVQNGNIRLSANGGVSTQLMLRPNGRLILGPVPFAESVQLHVAGSAMFGGDGSSLGQPRVVIGASHGGYGSVGFNFLPTGTLNTFKYLAASDFSSQLMFYEGGFLFRTAPVGTGGTDIPFSNVMTILPSGKVKIGAPTPPPADPNADPGPYKLRVYGDAYFDGNVTGAKVIGAVYQDLAEWVPASADMAPGTVVVLNRARNNEVMPSASAYDTTVAGVVSAAPGIILGVGGDSKEQIATTGRVRVRVDARVASVRVGDLLVTSDTAGTAMRSEPMSINGRSFHQPGTIIGKALEPLDGGVGEILVLLSMQ